MKESNSFEDALRRVLVPEKKEKPLPKPKKRKRSSYVSNAINESGNTGSPTTVGVQGGTLGGNGVGQFSKFPGDNSGAGSVDMRDIGLEEDAFAKSHVNRPYPLETVLDHIADSGEKLQDAQRLIEISLKKNKSLTAAQKKALEAATQTIKSSLGNISKAAKSINNIKIS